MARIQRSVEPPAGLTYAADFISEQEERTLLEHVQALVFRDIVMRGVVARRQALHFGWDYHYDDWKIVPAAPVPDFLEPLVRRCADAAGVTRDSLEQMLVARYPPGATIGWHRDAPTFGSPVIGVSIGAGCTIRFRRKEASGFVSYSQQLEPRSIYILAGDARTQWQHSIPAVKELRYSITLRTLARSAARQPAQTR